LGTVASQFEVHVIPVYTPEERMSPAGGVSVVVIVRPG
jgi:hypothetical protein